MSTKQIATINDIKIENISMPEYSSSSLKIDNFMDEHYGLTVIGFLGLAATGIVSLIASWMLLSTFVALIGTAIFAATTIFSIMLFQYFLTINEEMYSPFYQKIQDKRINRKMLKASNKLYKTVPWRPIEHALMPEGRTDTHDRFLVEAEACPKGVIINVVRWVYDPVIGWQKKDLPYGNPLLKKN